MRSRSLGLNGPTVSVLGLGCNNFGWRIGAEASRAVVDSALEQGITLFDTADAYGETASETMLGEALAGRRDRALLVTKFGYPVAGAPELPRGSGAYVRWAIDGSLRRLQTDAIDVYMYHRPDGETPLAETIGALAELVRAGKVSAIGISNHDAAQVEEAVAVAAVEDVPFVAAENRYSLVRRDAEAELLPACERLGIGMLPYYPLESGVLTGKYRRGGTAPAGSRFAAAADGGPWPVERWLTDDLFDRVEALEAYAAARGRPLLDIAIGGLLAMPGVTSVIAGATRPEQVRANVRASEWCPTASELAALPSPAAAAR